MRRRIIGLVGYARTGKSTVAAHLESAHGFVSIGFADRLKEVLASFDPKVRGRWLSAIIEDIGWEQTKDTIPEVRRALQVLGTACRTHIGPQVWVDPVMQDVARSRSDIVIPDVRYANEAAAVRLSGGVLVSIVRPDVGPANQHQSETGCASIHTEYVLRNTGTIDGLRARVDEIVGWLR